MKRKTKTLGPVVAALIAMSAIGASTASGAEFHANAAPTTLSGAQTTSHVLTTTSGYVACKTMSFSGTMGTTTATAITLTPSYGLCTAFGFLGVPFDANGCGLLLSSNGTTEIECPAGKEMEITVPGCTTTIGAQHLPAGGVTFANNAEKTDISITTNLTGIKYKECNGLVQANGTYQGTTTLTGSSNIAYDEAPKPTEFHANAAPSTLSGAQTETHVLTTTSGTVSCVLTSSSGTMGAKTTNVFTLTPNYGDCLFFPVAAPFHENGCAFLFHQNGTTEIECPAGKEMEITVPGCTITIGPQHFPAGSNTFANNGAKTDISITTNLTGIKYRECGGALQTKATYTGKTTLTGSSNIWWG